MIVDDFLAKPGKHHDRKFIKNVLSWWSKAEKFEFSEEASRLAGQLAFGAGDLILQHRQFARTPYDIMYVEMDSRSFHELAPAAPEKLDTDPTLTKDWKVGYLFVHDLLYVFASDATDYDMAPTYYVLARPGEVARLPDKMPARMFDPTTGEDKWSWLKLGIILATTVNKFSFAAREHKEDLLREVSVRWLDDKLRLPTGMTAQEYVEFCERFSGDVRNAWTFLLWLNQPTRTIFTSVPAYRSIKKGKLRVYKAHRVVNIQIGKVRSVRKAYLLGAPPLPKRRHRVRGQFHHHGGDTNCSHEWPMEPRKSYDGNDVWDCQKCGRKRWWVQRHMRGDATLGYVTKEYEVD